MASLIEFLLCTRSCAQYPIYILSFNLQCQPYELHAVIISVSPLGHWGSERLTCSALCGYWMEGKAVDLSLSLCSKLMPLPGHGHLIALGIGGRMKINQHWLLLVSLQPINGPVIFSSQKPGSHLDLFSSSLAFSPHPLVFKSWWF